MEENPGDPSSAATDATTEIPFHDSQATGVHHTVMNDFQSSSLPHLGDFITKLIEDAYKLQSVNAELERTKQLLRESEDKLASSEESKSHLSTDLDRTKQQLREAEDRLASSEEFKSPLSTQLDRTKHQLRWAENGLKREQKKNERLEADNMSLKASLRNHQDLLDGTESLRIKAENKLRALESRATILEADLRKKNDALEQKDEEMQLKIHGYKGRLGRLGSRFRKTWPIVRLLAASNFRGVEGGLIPRTFNNHDVLEEGLILAEIMREMDGEFAEFFREFRRDLCQTRRSTGSPV